MAHIGLSHAPAARPEAMDTWLTQLESEVDELTGLEAMIDQRMEARRDDLNTRMLSVERQLRKTKDPINQMAQDVAQIKQLLPDPADGPLARLKDQLTKD